MKEAKVIAILNKKGGVAKTCTALALFDGLTKKGYKALAIDLDPQGNLSLSTGLKTDGLTAEHLLEGTPVEEVIQKTDRGHLIAANDELAEEDIAADTLYKALQPVRSKYDYIIVDTPATLGTLTVNAIIASDGVIIPACADEYSLQGIGKLNSVTLPKANAARAMLNLPPVKIIGILITKYNARAIYAQAYLDYLEKLAIMMNSQVFKSHIRICVALQEASSLRKSIFDYAPTSNAAIDYENFIDELLKGYLR